jgi:site-specific recombinase XerD
MTLDAALSKVREVIRRKHLALATEENYCGWIARFSRFVSERCRDGSPEEKMEAFLTQLAQQDVSASTQNQAFCALLFFYRAALGGWTLSGQKSRCICGMRPSLRMSANYSRPCRMWVGIRRG